MTIRAYRRNCRRPRTYKRIQYDVMPVCVELDKALRKFYGEWSRMTNPACRLGWDVPEVGSRFHEVILEDRNVGWKSAPSAFPT
jgi:hypothetical protein